MGPAGRNVILDNSVGAPRITKDGVSVAKEIFLKDPVENQIAQIVKQASIKQEELTGDGTTTTAVLTRAIIDNILGNPDIVDKINARTLSVATIKRDIETAVTEVVSALKDMSQDVTSSEQVQAVATISANGDETVGKLIAEAMDRVGNDGVVTIKDGTSSETTLDVVEGMQFPQGYLSHLFINDEERQICEFKEANILVTNSNLSNDEDLEEGFAQLFRNDEPLVIIAPEFSPQVLSMWARNKMSHGLKVCLVKAPGVGKNQIEILRDIAVMSGGDFVDVAARGKPLTSEELIGSIGKMGTVKITANVTTLSDAGGDPEKIAERVDHINDRIKATPHAQDAEQLRERVSKLVGGVAEITIGGVTETEIKERRDRVDDALHATKAAMDEGILPGGGAALANIWYNIAKDHYKDAEDEPRDVGRDAVYAALLAPQQQILENAGWNFDHLEGASLTELTCDNAKASENASEIFGHDVTTGENVPMIKENIVDPTKVTRCALEDAASIAILLLSTEALLVTKTDGTEFDNPTFNPQLA